MNDADALCHICGKPNSGLGALWCSGGHRIRDYASLAQEYEKLREMIQEGNARYSALFGDLEAARMKIALIQSFAVVLRANSDPSSIEYRIADELDNRLKTSSVPRTAPSGT